MRRWGVMAVIVLLMAAFAGNLLPELSTRREPADSPTGMAALGLILLEDEGGLYVLGVTDGSLASSAGIMPGDYLTMVRETALTTSSQLEELLAEQPGESMLPLTLARQEKTFTVNLSLR